jgi:putative ABC transport system ATP-binding protein
LVIQQIGEKTSELVNKKTNEQTSAHIEFRAVTRSFDFGNHRLKALDDVSFSIDRGEFVVVLGPSGAGKSTLLNLLGGMDSAQDGQVLIDGVDILRLKDAELTRFRAQNIGFIFQYYNLIPTLTALENVAITRKINKDAFDALWALEQVDLLDHAGQFPSQLSGGEQQRVSIARAIAKNTDLLLCDEPTGALDTVTGREVMTLLEDLNINQGKTVVMVTHNEAFVQMATTVIRFKNGRLQSQEHIPARRSIREVEW